MDSYGFLEILPQGCSNLTNLATQKRPNTEPQGVPEALETLIRQQIKFCSVDLVLLHGFPWICIDSKHKKG